MNIIITMIAMFIHVLVIALNLITAIMAIVITVCVVMSFYDVFAQVLLSTNTRKP